MSKNLTFLQLRYTVFIIINSGVKKQISSKMLKRSFLVSGTGFQYGFEKSCLSHKPFVTLSSVAVSRQKGKPRGVRIEINLIKHLFILDLPF